jgi:flagellar motor switch protein FliM
MKTEGRIVKVTNPAMPGLARVEPMDECRAESLSRAQVDLAQAAFQRFLDAAGRGLQSYLGVPVETSFADATQCPLAQAIPKDFDAGCVLSLDLKPLAGAAYLILETKLVSIALEILLGAPLDAVGKSRESLSELDLRMMHGVNALLTSALQKEWEPVFGSSFQPLAASAGNKIAKADGQNMLVLSAGIGLNEAAASLKLAIPSVLVRLACQPESKPQPSASLNRAALAEAMGSATVSVEALLTGAGIRMRDLLALKPGSTLELPQAVDTQIECRMNGVAKLHGEVLAGGGGVAFQVNSRITSPL